MVVVVVVWCGGVGVQMQKRTCTCVCAAGLWAPASRRARKSTYAPPVGSDRSTCPAGARSRAAAAGPVARGAPEGRSRDGLEQGGVSAPSVRERREQNRIVLHDRI